MAASSRHVYLPPDSPRLAVVAPRVAKRFPAATLVASRDELKATFGEWTMRIVDFREPWVAEEARELSNKAPADARACLERSSHRLELYDTGELDTDDIHYNDGLQVWEFFLALPGAVGLDPVTGEFSVHPSQKTRAAARAARPIPRRPGAPAPKAAPKKKPAAKKKAAKKSAKKKPAKKK